MSPRHLLVLINPVGGQGNAVSDFRQHVEPLFLLAEINCNVVITSEGGERTTKLMGGEGREDTYVFCCYTVGLVFQKCFHNEVHVLYTTCM